MIRRTGRVWMGMGAGNGEGAVPSKELDEPDELGGEGSGTGL
jgi:hypothetical protein